MKTFFFFFCDEHNSSALLFFPNWGVNPSPKPLHTLLFNLRMWTKLALREGGNQLCPSFRLSKQKKITFQASTTRNTFMSGWPDKWVLLLTCRWISAVCVTDLAFHFLWWWQEVFLEAHHEGAATGVFCSPHFLVEKGDRSDLVVQYGRGLHLTFSSVYGEKIGTLSQGPRYSFER